MLFSALPMASMAVSASIENATYSESSLSVDGGTVYYHRIQQSEVDSLQTLLGVRQDGVDYNLLYDGHGTGLSPLSSSEYSTLTEQAYVVSSVVSDLTYASSLDLSNSPYFPAVGDQLSLGACAAWAMTYYCYGYLEAKDQGWTQASSGLASQVLSPTFTYNRISDYNTGSSLSGNAYVIRDWGAATMATMPYDVTDYLSWGSDVAQREAIAHRALSVMYITSATVDTLKVVLQSGSPVTFAMDALTFGTVFNGDGTKKIISAADYNTASLNHAQTIVGWDDTVSEDGDVGAFRVVNSWGTGFAEGGYYWITYKAMLEMLALSPPTYIQDRVGYQPQVTAVVHFSAMPARDSTFSCILQSNVTGTAVKTRTFYYRTTYYQGTAPAFPEYLFVDLTDLLTSYSATNSRFAISFSGGSKTGTVSSYHLEWYDGSYVAGSPTQRSAFAAGLPATTKTVISLASTKYTQMTLAAALDTTALTLSTSGEACWTPVVDTSYYGGDSVVSGDIGNSHSSTLKGTIAGPATVSFYWKVTSESGADYLKCSVDSTVQASISGTTAWTKVSLNIASGTHTITWTYSKSAATSVGADCGYVDRIDTTGGTSDSTAPVTSATLSGTTGTNGWYTTTVSATLTASDSGGVQSTMYKLDSGAWTAYAAPVSITLDGTHTLQYYSVDASGNVEATKSATIKKDSTAPVTTSTTSGYSVTLSRSDAVSGISTTMYSIDSGAWKTYTAAFSAGTTGTHVVKFYSVDKAGNTESTKQISVGGTDTVGPVSSVTLSGTTGSNGWYTTNVGIKIAATDAASGVATTYYKIDSGAWTAYAGYFVYSSDGTHTLQYYSVDTLGNIEATKSTTFKKDAVAPTTSSAVSGSTVTLTSNDVTSKVATIYYQVDGGSWTLYTGAFSAGTAGVQHTVQFYAVDNAGNIEATKQVNVYVDTGAVKVAPSAPTSLSARTTIGGIKLTWIAPLNTGSAPLSGYKIYRSLGTGTLVLIGTSATTSYSDTTMVANQQYRYYVTAYSSAGESAKLGPMIIKLSTILSSESLLGETGMIDIPSDGSDMGEMVQRVPFWVACFAAIVLVGMAFWVIKRRA
ncbi:MAG: Papain family cysteine protease [Methanomassiliicoccales archaeon PtaU1.Bin124]|nr:MAG: Papain family cysteine protease [Methanomassiliicoccales archaeon PtaU1.Bin124]